MYDEPLKYNYVFFDAQDSKLRKNKDGFRYICSMELEKFSNTILVTYPYDYAPFIVRLLFLLHNNERINKIIKLPFRKLWYPGYFKNTFKDKNRPICFVLSGGYFNQDYLDYLRKKYPDCKFVKIYRDLVHLWVGRHPKEAPILMEKYFDLSCAYDKGDCEKYNYPYFPELESKIDLPKDPNYPLCDVFFAGKAKNRLDKIISVYDKLTSLGLKCKFYITGTENMNPPLREGITYAKKNMTYYQMLYNSVNANVILEINQEGATGYTSRFLEAVIYNKKLITNNLSIANSDFYNKDYIALVDDNFNIDKDFFKDYDKVNYRYNGEFSPLNLIKLIDDELIKKFGY